MGEAQVDGHKSYSFYPNQEPEEGNGGYEKPAIDSIPHHHIL